MPGETFTCYCGKVRDLKDAHYRVIGGRPWCSISCEAGNRTIQDKAHTKAPKRSLRQDRSTGRPGGGW